jgi:hypothetical protein
VAFVVVLTDPWFKVSSTDTTVATTATHVNTTKPLEIIDIGLTDRPKNLALDLNK